MTVEPSLPSTPTAGSSEHEDPAGGRLAPVRMVPMRASGVRLDGPMQGSGYRVTPHLARRGDGQVVQLTPLLAAILDAVDGRRDITEIAHDAGRATGRDLHPDDVALLLEHKLRPLGLLRGPDGSDPSVSRTNPMLGLRGRLRLVSAERTNRVIRPFLWLFRPPVAVLVILAFAGISVWALLEHGMSQPIESAMADPALLLVLIGLIVASAAFHELGHAAACRYGGATPGVMGAAVYLIWPAFYTDVTDSYRLGRAARLRTDLGGLYFNAVFTVAAGGVYAVTGAEALLVLVPVQLLQMVRQLVPLVRFDGYHILADLVGVPDLFSRIRPTLRRALPWHRSDQPNPLRPWAQAVVVTWVVVVVPVLLVSFALLLMNLPTVIASAVRSLRLQSELLGTNFDQGRSSAVALGVVAMLTVAFVPLSTLYLGGRILHRGSRKFWQATEGRPVPRAAAFAVAAALVIAAGPGLLPAPPAADASDDVAAPLLGGPGTEFALGGSALQPAPLSESDARQELTSETAHRHGHPVVDASASSTDGHWTPPAVTVDVEARSTTASPPTGVPSDAAVAWPFQFPPPEPAGAGGNQVLVTNWTDGSVVSDLSASLVWDVDGVIDNENSAYAFAACTRCRTTAAAFQIVASTVPTDTVVPQNLAVAANEDCDTCATTAVAVQLVVTLDGEPDPGARARLRDLVAEIAARESAYATADPGVIRAELRSAKAQALEILRPWIDDIGADVDDNDDADSTTDDGNTGAEDGPTEVEAHPVDDGDPPRTADDPTDADVTDDTSQDSEERTGADAETTDTAPSESTTTDGTTDEETSPETSPSSEPEPDAPADEPPPPETTTTSTTPESTEPSPADGASSSEQGAGERPSDGSP